MEKMEYISKRNSGLASKNAQNFSSCSPSVMTIFELYFLEFSKKQQSARTYY